MKVKEIIKAVSEKKARSKWVKGVKEYALEMLERTIIDTEKEADRLNAGELLNHVGGDRFKIGCFWSPDVWALCKECSWDGKFHIYDDEIAEKLISKSEIARKTNKDGTLKNPNSREQWLDTQARAIYTALHLIEHFAKMGA
ncbi:MAG: hypothetical protein MJY99_08785 [Fibrobacter sp.]|nr:hypothetical protein [Fibrobacter sp.]